MKGPDQIDAIVLAGDRGASRNFSGGNKAFLAIHGTPMVLKIVQVLQSIPCIGSIVVVGPSSRLIEVLNGKPVSILEQADNVYQNFWQAFTSLISLDKSGNANTQAQLDKAVLVVPSDMPFPSPVEIENFLSSCIDRQLDYGVGMTERRYLERYLPTADRPGLTFQYLHLSDASLRLNNLHYARPLRVENREYIQRIYELRYQKDLKNIWAVAHDLLIRRRLGPAALQLYLLLQLANLADRCDYRRVFRWARAGITRERVTYVAGRLLDGRTEIVETREGCCAVDIDNEADHQTIEQHYDEFVESG